MLGAVQRADLPRAFIELYEAGRFDYWSAPYQSLTSVDRDRLIVERALRVLWWPTIEWDCSLEEIVAPPPDDYWRPGLVRFAGDGYGQCYCWYPRWAEAGAEPPVIFASADDDESRLFARSFIECACRCFAQAHASWNDDEDDHPYPRDVRWRAHLDILRPYLSDELATLIDHGDRVPSPEECAAIDDDIAARVGTRKLTTFMLPVKYAIPPLITGRIPGAEVAAYEQSVAFYKELVEVEGRREFVGQLREAEANLEDAVSRLAAGKS
jgi:hypothetical protein